MSPGACIFLSAQLSCPAVLPVHVANVGGRVIGVARAPALLVLLTLAVLVVVLVLVVILVLMLVLIWPLVSILVWRGVSWLVAPSPSTGVTSVLISGASALLASRPIYCADRCCLLEGGGVR